MKGVPPSGSGLRPGGLSQSSLSQAEPLVPNAISKHDEEFMQGYFDGRDPNAPEPSANRSYCYRHSFAVGRAEINGNQIPAVVSRERAAEAEALDAAQSERTGA